MLGNQPLLHRNAGHDDDGLTIQVSDANSQLGNLLLEADWDETLDYLTTPEGRNDVEARNDPLGLSKSQSTIKNKLAHIPKSKNTAFFAALFVRAPYNVIESIVRVAPSHVDQPNDLMYVLSIIPSEEGARLQELSKKVPHRTRAWSKEEYSQILHLLLKSFVSSNSPSSVLLDYWPSWVIGTTNVRLTPLAIAAYNPDVPAKVVQLVCTLEPDAMNKQQCNFFGAADVQTTPLIIAAASPVPPKSSAQYEVARNARWEKVKLLSLDKGWYNEEREVLYQSTTGSDTAEIAVSSPPEPTLQQAEDTCHEAMKRNEWELVREILKQYCEAGESTNMDKDLAKIQSALTKHDEQTSAALNKRMQAREKAQKRDEWLHNNMGLAMYPVHAFLDLVSVVMPAPKADVDSGIVKPMS